MILFKSPWLLIQLIVIFLNPWWWIIFQRNIWVGLLVIILSLVVFKYFWYSNIEKLLLPLLIFTAISFFISVKDAFDISIFRYSTLEIQQLNKRHEFYANGLGKIYTNRISLSYFKDFNLPISKLQRNFFGNLDPNQYFFASHPRERAGVEEFQKYIPLFLPFFVIGLLYSIHVPLLALLIYLVIVSLISSVISASYNLGPILFFPLINFMITIGIILSLKFLKTIK
ncbi:hypothetical protein HYW41_01760 [Candidatus Daviesbacteria bacterium]|nr:hypothetical protein [Candidatus Daviesbacteria bacterium]